jgi:FtsH-binding integral membrane protein
MSSPPRYTDNPPAPAQGDAGPLPLKSYGTTTDNEAAAAQPLLAASSSHNAWMDQAEDDVPDDFKVGVNVIDCDAAIRLSFIRKVYSILFIQLLLTAVVSLCLSHPKAVEFNQAHPWLILIPGLGNFVALMGVYWKRHQYPANLVLLGVFTLFESMLIGTVTSYYDSRIVRISS